MESPRASSLSQEVVTGPGPKGQGDHRALLPRGRGRSLSAQTPFHPVQADLEGPLPAAIQPGFLHSSANWESPLKILGCLRHRGALFQSRPCSI